MRDAMETVLGRRYAESAEIEVQQAEVDRIRQRLNEAEGKLRKMRELALPFKVGDEVIVTRYRKPPTRALVRGVHPGYGGQADYLVSYYLASGKLSEVTRHAYGRMEKAAEA